MKPLFRILLLGVPLLSAAINPVHAQLTSDDVTLLQDGYDSAEERVRQHKTDAVVSIKTLAAECDANRVRAQNKYQDKIIQTTGVISDFGAFTLSVTLDVPDGGLLPSHVECGFARNSKGIVSKLDKGETVTVRGLFGGCIVNPELEGCIVAKPSAETR